MQAMFRDFILACKDNSIQIWMLEYIKMALIKIEVVILVIVNF
jgi:hypothetical protein